MEKAYHASGDGRSKSQSHSITYVCVATGALHGRANVYIDRLYQMLVRFSPRPFNLLCITDQRRAIATAIEQIDCSGWQEFKRPGSHPTYQKLALFSHERLPYDELFYLDLSLIIQADLRPVIEYADKSDAALVAVRGWFESPLNSCVMRIRNRSLGFIYEDFVRGAHYPHHVPGDQDFISGAMTAESQSADHFPASQIVSFKKLMRLGQNDWNTAHETALGAVIIKFHGRPKPDEIVDPLYIPLRYGPRYWLRGHLRFPIDIQHLKNCWTTTPGTT